MVDSFSVKHWSEAGQAIAAGRRLLREREVVDRTTLSASEIRRREKRGDFPAHVKLGPRRKAWIETDIDQWIWQQIAERDGR